MYFVFWKNFRRDKRDDFTMPNPNPDLAMRRRFLAMRRKKQDDQNEVKQNY